MVHEVTLIAERFFMVYLLALLILNVSLVGCALARLLNEGLRPQLSSIGRWVVSQSSGDASRAALFTSRTPKDSLPWSGPSLTAWARSFSKTSASSALMPAS